MRIGVVRTNEEVLTFWTKLGFVATARSSHIDTAICRRKRSSSRSHFAPLNLSVSRTHGSYTNRLLLNPDPSAHALIVGQRGPASPLTIAVDHGMNGGRCR